MKLLNNSGTAAIMTCYIAAALLIFTGTHQAAAQPANTMVKDDTSKLPAYHRFKPTALIIADPRSTEMFDMLAPFYIFSSTGRMNVFIVSKENTPVLIKKDLYVLPPAYV
ncbi:hypothetical protein FFF34_002690 [Inquilinus sp. KBS0705]|nr:hypothetical protein FFF34_002690 [Inquilinus sp. KBS0705]